MFDIKKCVINIAIFVLNIVYIPFKLFKTQNKVTYISRQSDTPSLDFNLLISQIKKRDKEAKQVVLTKKIGKGVFGKITYALHMFVQLYHLATSKVIVIDSYVIAVSVLKHKKSLRIIQIWHALGAIKKFGYQVIGKKEGSSDVVARGMKMHKNYDYVTCASNVTKEYYSEAFNIDKEKIKVIGMPRVDYILNNDRNVEMLEKNPDYIGKKTILYIPTFRKNKGVDIRTIINHVDLDKYNLIIKLHPLDETQVEDRFKPKGDFSTYDLMKFADYIISDYSASVIEASILLKPLYLWVYDIDEYSEFRGLNINLVEELKENTSKYIEDIIKKIESGIFDYDSLKKFRDKYVETYDENNTENICKLIEENL